MSVTTASDYVNLGWAVVPCCSPAEGDGRGCKQHGPQCPSPGKRPLVSWERYQRKAPSSSTVKRWKAKWPDANWGVITGAASGVAVLDLDSHDAHHQLGEFPLTATVATSRGQHLYFALRKRVPPSMRLGEHVELKAAKAFVVVPNSRHASGTHYRWVISPEEKLAKLPQWVWERVTQAKRNSRWDQPKLPTQTVVNGVREGRRNTAAAQMAGVLLCRFEPELWESHCWPLLVAWNSRCRPPLSLEELRGVFDKISAREAKQRIKRAESLLRDKRNQDLAHRIAERLRCDPKLGRTQLKRLLHGYRYNAFDTLFDAAQLQHTDSGDNDGDAFRVGPPAPTPFKN